MVETELEVQRMNHLGNNHVNHVPTRSDHVHQIDKIGNDNVGMIKGYFAEVLWYLIKVSVLVGMPQIFRVHELL